VKNTDRKPNSRKPALPERSQRKKKSPKTCIHNEELKTEPYPPDPKREQTKEPNNTTQDLK
jgi:hypothetical protein